MTKKIAYIERVMDSHNVERVYGYTLDGAKYLLNLQEIIGEYKKRGIKGVMEEVV